MMNAKSTANLVLKAGQVIKLHNVKKNFPNLLTGYPKLKPYLELRAGAGVGASGSDYSFLVAGEGTITGSGSGKSDNDDGVYRLVPVADKDTTESVAAPTGALNDDLVAYGEIEVILDVKKLPKVRVCVVCCVVYPILLLAYYILNLTRIVSLFKGCYLRFTGESEREDSRGVFQVEEG